ncbi:MAG: ATPase, T2SS/T4P/T4SS family [Candidatus Hermodarchaeia archaeon]
MVCSFQLVEDYNAANILTFNCDICSCNKPDKGDITRSPYCRQQFLQILPFTEGSFPSQFISNDQIVSIPRHSVEILKEYISIIAKFEPHLHDIFREYPEIKQQMLSEPYSAYRFLKTTYKPSGNRVFRDFLFALERTRLISLATKYLGDKSSTDQVLFFEGLLGAQRKRIGYSKSNLVDNSSLLLKKYEVGPFSIRVFELTHRPLEKFYQAVVSLDEILLPNLIQNLFSHQQRLAIEEPRIQTLDTLLTRKISDFQQYLIANFKELTSVEQKNLAIYATTQILNLSKTMPLLLDDEVQEIFLDKPGAAYYLDHAEWGRCNTNLVPMESELSHIITRLRLESRRPLDERNPSLKTELKTKLFHVRAAIDIPPLAYEGPHLNIRKIRLRTLTMPELVTNGTLSLSASAFLILCMTLRINITICGEPSTGKTTLANAINLLAPPNWRKIAIEDALESITVDEGDRHKVTFRVDPFDSFGKTQSTKSNEIIRLLHRSPDWVFLGEIQTAEHSAAMFHAISAGIRGIQTCHANSNQELLLRWQVHHDIPEISFQSLGLLVHMIREVVRGQIIRRVAQISEVRFEAEKAVLHPIFEWNKSSGELVQNNVDLNSMVISRACQFHELRQADIRKRRRIYQETLASLISSQEYNPKTIVTAFDRAYADEAPVKANSGSLHEKKGGDKTSITSLH